MSPIRPSTRKANKHMLENNEAEEPPAKRHATDEVATEDNDADQEVQPGPGVQANEATAGSEGETGDPPSDPVAPIHRPPGVNELTLASVAHRIKDSGYIPLPLIREKLNKIANRTDVQACHYPLGDAPIDDADWGGSNSDYLYLRGKKLLVSFVARFLEGRFTEDGGKKDGAKKPRMRPALRCKPTREVDGDMARFIIADLCEPSWSPTRNSIWVGALSTSRSGGKATAVPYRFCYDGTLVTSLSKMKTIDVNTLRPNDIVYIQATVNRYKRKDKRRGSDGEDDPWAEYSTQLELFRIIKLFKAPASAPKEPDSGDERATVDDADDLEF